MRRFVSTVLAAVFFIWILPLGVFIDPSKEKIACDGQRAICLCSHAAGNALAKKNQSGENVMKANPGANKEAASSFSSGQYDLAAHFFDQKNRTRLYFSSHRNFYQILVCKPIDHVPKA